MFWSKYKNKVYPCKSQFYYIKVGCKGVFVTRNCFLDVDIVPLGALDRLWHLIVTLPEPSRELFSLQ